MRKQTRFLLALLLLLALVACQQEDVTPTATEIAQEVVTEPTLEPTATTEPPTATPEPTETPEPTNTPEPAYVPVFETESCEFQVPPGRDVECGWLTVPEDRSQPDKMIHLHVAIFHSDSDNPAPDPIVYLEGGPGGDALEAVPLIFELRFAPFLANHDLINVALAIPNLHWPALKKRKSVLPYWSRISQPNKPLNNCSTLYSPARNGYWPRESTWRLIIAARMPLI